MKTILPVNHKYKDYVKGNGIEISKLDCLNYTCFSPGEINSNWICNIKENHGCPDHPKKIIK